jgi:hypothetical protein
MAVEGLEPDLLGPAPAGAAVAAAIPALMDDQRHDRKSERQGDPDG